MKNRNAKRVAVMSAALAAATFGMCTSSYAQDQSNPSNTTGQKMDNAADRAGNAAQRGADRTGDAMQRGADRAGDAMQRGADRTANAADRMADHSANALNPSATSDIRKTVATATEASLTKGGLDDLVERFSQADRDRLNKDANIKGDHATLDGRIAQFQKDWKEKYNQDFSIAANRDTIYNDGFAKMMSGDFGDTARTANDRIEAAARTSSDPSPTGDMGRPNNTNASSNTPGAQTGSPAAPTNESVRNGNMNSTAGENAAAQNAARDAVRGGTQGNATGVGTAGTGTAGTAAGTADARTASDASRAADGMSRAVVSIPAGHGLPEVNVPLVREGGTWKIDVPDSYTGVELSTNLLKHLTAADEMKAQWPADANEAYRIVTHHVLAAIVNADAQSSGMTAPAGATGTHSMDNMGK